MSPKEPSLEKCCPSAHKRIQNLVSRLRIHLNECSWNLRSPIPAVRWLMYCPRTPTRYIPHGGCKTWIFLGCRLEPKGRILPQETNLRSFGLEFAVDFTLDYCPGENWLAFIVRKNSHYAFDIIRLVVELYEFVGPLFPFARMTASQMSNQRHLTNVTTIWTAHTAASIRSLNLDALNHGISNHLAARPPSRARCCFFKALIANATAAITSSLSS